MAFIGGTRGDVVDVDSLGEEEDALDGVSGKRLAGCWIESLHGEELDRLPGKRRTRRLVVMLEKR